MTQSTDHSGAPRETRPAHHSKEAGSAHHIRPVTAPTLTPYYIARLVLGSNLRIADVVDRVVGGSWQCPVFGVVCTLMPSAA